jgi:hypothetical protein
VKRLGRNIFFSITKTTKTPTKKIKYKKQQTHVLEAWMLGEQMGTETISESYPQDWKSFLRKHKSALAVFVVAVILASAGAVYVFWWFTGYAQSTGLVPSGLGLWTMANLVFFILHLIFWELVLIGIPVAVSAIVAWQWWKRLPPHEKYAFGKRSKSRNAEGAISPLLFIAFAIKVYVDGNWNVAISTWNLNYVVGSMITILIWIAIIFGIPLAIGAIWWLNREMKKQ